ncbi:MAG: hypothetical protein PHF37_05715 [Phycisphaerae bacterium]|nr:hypothetical protein [Phycisphaerae bacterium]
MASLADLKRALSLGTGIVMTGCLGVTKTQSARLGAVRYVVKVNTIGVELAEDKTATKGSFLAWPKASLLEFDGKTIKIYQSGTRPLADIEARIMAGKPVDAKQSEIDCLTDGSTMFRREQAYFRTVEDGKFFYLFGTERQCGKRLTYARDAANTPMIDDNDCKGVMSLEYELTA